MNISKEYNDNELTLSVEGELDTFNSQEFEMEINSEIGYCDSLILDFEKLEYISSAGLRAIITTHKKLQLQKSSFKIINANEIIKDIFSVSGLDQFLDIEYK